MPSASTVFTEVFSVAVRIPLITARPPKRRAAAALSRSCFVVKSSPNLEPPD